jgi:hypothetical protein
MDDPDALLPVESAGNVAGISPRTLRYWIRGGKLPATEGQHGKLVRLGDVLAIAEMTGKRPAANRQSAGNEMRVETSARSAGNAAGNTIQDDDAEALMATGVAALPATAGTMQAALEVFRDELVRPFVDDLRAAERTIGRLEAERDQAIAERDALRVELERVHDAPVAANQDLGEAMPAATTTDAVPPDASFWSRFWRALTGR